MAHFAKIESNLVTQVIVVNNSDILDASNNESEAYNGNIRKNYAGIGYTYDTSRDAFIEPTPYSSWVLNETTCRYEAPIAYPSDGKHYGWNEATTSWVEN